MTETQAGHREELVLGSGGGGLDRRHVGVEPPDAPDQIGGHRAAPDVAPGGGEAAERRTAGRC